jgi:hypothetical protein
MNDPLKISRPQTSLDLDSGTSSPESVDGPTRFDSPEFPTTPTSGPAHAPVSLSRARARGAERATLDIFGRHGSHSSRSVALQSSLENRLRASMDSAGSTLFTLTWNDAVTPSGRRIFARRASVRRTSDNDCISWPTPVVNDATGSDYAYSQGNHDRKVLKLGGGSQTRHGPPNLSSWATPTVSQAGGNAEQFLDRKRRARTCGIALTDLGLQVKTWIRSGWPTAVATDGKGATKPGQPRGTLCDPAGWPTPTASLADKGVRSEEGAIREAMRNHGPDLAAAVSLARGPTFDGSSAPTASAAPSQLNPRFSLWLQGYPIEWASCGEAVTRSSRKSQPDLSKPQKRRGG